MVLLLSHPFSDKILFVLLSSLSIRLMLPCIIPIPTLQRRATGMKYCKFKLVVKYEYDTDTTTETSTSSGNNRTSVTLMPSRNVVTTCSDQRPHSLTKISMETSRSKCVYLAYDIYLSMIIIVQIFRD